MFFLPPLFSSGTFNALSMRVPHRFTPTRSSQPIRDQTWIALYFCDSSLFLRHRAPQVTSPGTLLATSVCATDRQGWSQRRGAISHRQPVGLVLRQFVFPPLYTCPNFLWLAYVQSLRTSTIFPCTRSFICRSGLLWGTVTQDPTLSFTDGRIR